MRPAPPAPHRRRKLKDPEQAFWIQAVEGAASNPAAWAASADSLKRAADAVLAADQVRTAKLFTLARDAYLSLTPEALAELHGSTAHVYMLLAALAVENAVKGIIVARSPRTVRGGPKERKKSRPDGLFPSWRGTTGHDLDRLVRQARALHVVRQSDRPLLRRLTRFIRWAGRYPVPFDPADHRSAPIRFPEDPASIDALYTALLRKLDAEALRRAALGEQAKKERSGRRRTLLLQRLAAYERLEEGNVAVFVRRRRITAPADRAADLGSNLITCSACAAGFVLDARRRAALCACGTLYYATAAYDGGRGRWVLNVADYPAPVTRPHGT
jgi:hypothetical protein